MLLKRALFTLLLVLGGVSGSFAVATASGSPAAAPNAYVFQDNDDATAEADDSSDDADDARGASTGNSVEVVDEQGEPVLSITIEDVMLPWEDYSEYSTPDRGFYYVALHVTVENISDSEQEVSDFDFFVRDEFGFIYGTTYASIAEGSASEEIGEFEGDDVDAGDSVTGLMIFAVPTEGELVDVFYAPLGRLITVATLG